MQKFNRSPMHLIDLTHPIETNMPVFPGTPQVKILQFSTVAKEGFAEKELFLGTHVGTHMDAPAHMLENGKTLDQFFVSKFSGQACIIPFSHDDLDGKNQADYFADFEDVIRESDFIILRTGWSEKWGSDDYYSGFPALDKAGAQFLGGFRLNGIGTDAISIDKHNSTTYDTHYELLKNEILIIENLTGLEQIRTQKFRFIALPLKIAQADGSPVRAVAEY